MIYKEIKQEIEKELKKRKVNAQIEKSRGTGFFAVPLFREKNPQNRAIELEKELQGKIKSIRKIEAQGPYLNFFLNYEYLEGKKDKLEKEKKKVMIEFSSPNTNKPLHLGHLRNDFTGMFLSRLFKKFGIKVLKANLLNDKGLAMAKTIYALRENPGTPEKAGMKSDHYVGYLYTLYNEKYKDKEEEVKEIIRLFEKGDKKTLALWKKITKWAIDGYKETYKRIDSKFDIIYRESEIYKKSETIIKEGLEKGVFKKDGVVKAKLEPELPDKIVLREDGTSLYITNDLYLTKKKIKENKIDRHYWVVASEQSLYFKQLIKIFEKLGYPFAKKLEHISYGLVNLPSGRMKSREGTIVDADNLLDDIKKLAEKELEKRNSPKKRAETIALAAIKFAILKTDKNKEIVYNPEESLKFEGDTGPYLLYTYARAKSILRKSRKKLKKEIKEPLKPKERKLLSLLIQYNKALVESKELKSPHPLSQYLLELAETFNSFYHLEQFIGSKKEPEYLYLTKRITETLKDGLEILGIEVLEQM